MIALAALLLLALAARLVALAGARLIETDGVRFIEIARQFQATGSPFDTLFHPLYPALLGLGQRVLPDWEVTGRLIALLFGVALLLPACALAAEVFDRRVALLTGALLAVHPGLVRNSVSVLSDSTYTFLLTLGAWLGWRALAGGRHAALVGAAAALGLAYLVRPEAAIYGVALLSLALAAALRRGERAPRMPWIAGALVAFVVLAGPYVIFLHQALGHWTLSGKVAHNLAQDLGPSVAGTPLTHPLSIARRVFENAFLFQKYALPELLPGLLALFLVPGVIVRALDRRWRVRDGVLLALLLPPFASFAFHIEARVFFPVLAFVLPFVAAGLLAAGGWLARGGAAGRWATGLTVIVLALLLPAIAAPLLRPDPALAVYRDAARFIADNYPPNVVVLDRKPFVAFYSSLRHAPLPDVAPADLLAAARRAGAGLVVLDSQNVGDRSRLAPLVWAPPPPGFEVVRDFDAGATTRLRVLAPSPRG